VTDQQPEAPASPGVTRWRRKLAEPFEVEAVELVEDLDWEALARWCGGRIETYACGDSGEYESHMVVPAERGEVSAFEGDFLVRRPDGKFEVRDFDRGWFAATFEPAPEPLTASQCDRLRQTAAEHANAVEAVKRACNLAVKLGGAYPEVNETVAAAREALRVLSGEETDAGPGSAIVETLEALPVAAALDRESLRELIMAAAGRDDGPWTAGERIVDAVWPLLEHAQYALSDNEGVRLWMLDCGELVAKHRARAEAAAAELTGLRSLLEGGPAGAAARRRALAIIGAERDSDHG
jgi:hypothetical protein